MEIHGRVIRMSSFYTAKIKKAREVEEIGRYAKSNNSINFLNNKKIMIFLPNVILLPCKL